MSAIDFGTRLGQTGPPEPLLLRVDVRLRLAICTLFAFVTVGLQHLPALIGCLGLSLVCAAAARLELWPTLKRMASLDGFMMFVVGFLPFTVPGPAAGSLLGFDISMTGVERAAAILLASNAVALMVLTQIGTMDEAELGSALAGLRVPAKLTHLLLLTTRYIDVLQREYGRLRTSMKVRGFRMGCNRHTWKMVGYLFGMLLVRSIERSERILIAMRCRGYRGELHMLRQPRSFGWIDAAFMVASAISLAALIALDHA